MYEYIIPKNRGKT